LERLGPLAAEDERLEEGAHRPLREHAARLLEGDREI
jgi:hypothetical protein